MDWTNILAFLKVVTTLLTVAIVIYIAWLGYQKYNETKKDLDKLTNTATDLANTANDVVNTISAGVEDVGSALSQVFEPKSLNCPSGQTLRGLLCYDKCKDDEKSDGTYGCYKKCPNEWPGSTSLTHCQHKTIYSTVGTDGLPNVCDGNDVRKDGLCYRIDSDEEYSSPGFVKLKSCPSNTKRDDGTTCWLYDTHIFNRDAWTATKSIDRCYDRYGQNTCSQSGAYYYPSCNREAKYWASEISTKDGKCVDLPNGNTDNGTKLQLWNCNGYGEGNAAQRLFYDRESKTVRNGYLKDMNKCVDIPNGDIKNGAKLQMWDCNGSDAQKFEYEEDSGVFRSTKNPNFCWDIPGGNTANGSQLQLWECNGSAAQSFKHNPIWDYTNDGLTCRRDPVTKSKIRSRIGYAPTKCPSGKEKKKGLCYPICPENYERRGDNIEYCSTKCPDGFTNVGLGGCQRPRNNVSGGKGITVVGECSWDYPIRTGDLCYRDTKPIFGKKGTMFLKNKGSDQCLAKDQNGGLTLRSCDMKDLGQQFKYNQDNFMLSTLSEESRCLDDGGGDKNRPTNIYFSNGCDISNMNMKFTFDKNTNTIRAAAKDSACVDTVKGRANAVLWKCEKDNVNQIFYPGFLNKTGDLIEWL